MPLPAQEKQKVMSQYRRKEGDTGSPEVQIHATDLKLGHGIPPPRI